MSDPLCPHCGAVLGVAHVCVSEPVGRLSVFPLPPSDAETGARWVKLRECADQVEGELIAGLLAGGGVDVHVESRTFSQEPMPSQRSFSRIVLWVREEQSEEAQRVLADGAGAQTTCSICGGPMDDAVCPACAEAAAPQEG